MRELASYDFWDLEHDSPIAGLEPRDFILAPLPRFPDLIAWSRPRLMKGLHDGDAPAGRSRIPPESASRSAASAAAIA